MIQKYLLSNIIFYNAFFKAIFIEQLNTKQFKEVQKFFETMPKLKHDITIKNPKTKKESKVTLTGLNDFFA